MEQLRKKIKKYKIITKICSLVGAGTILLGCAALTCISFGFANLGVTLLGATALCLAPCHVVYYILSPKVENLEEYFASSINGTTPVETKFETSEYISCKEDKKEPIVLSTQEIGIDEFKEKHKKEYEADISL